MKKSFIHLLTVAANVDYKFGVSVEENVNMGDQMAMVGTPGSLTDDRADMAARAVSKRKDTLHTYIENR